MRLRSSAQLWPAPCPRGSSALSSKARSAEVYLLAPAGRVSQAWVKERKTERKKKERIKRERESKRERKTLAVKPTGGQTHKVPKRGAYDRRQRTAQPSWRGPLFGGPPKRGEIEEEAEEEGRRRRTKKKQQGTSTNRWQLASLSKGLKCIAAICVKLTA